MKRKVIYYDTETTGVRSESDRIIELGAYDADSKESFVRLIKPGIPIPADATAIHNITEEMVENAPDFSVIGKEFIDFCGPEAILIAHNNEAFDKRFLMAEFERHALTLPAWDWVDTLKWSRKYRNDLPKHSLQFLREVYEVEANDAHRALDDVIVLHKVFSQMIGDLSMEQVLELMKTKPKRDLDRMPFGKHQGKALSEVPKSYARWLQENGALDKPENEELRAAFEKIGYLSPA